MGSIAGWRQAGEAAVAGILVADNDTILSIANRAPNLVSIVLDGCFGDRLIELASAGPVWIIDSPGNRTVAEFYWQKNFIASHLGGVTLFKEFKDASPEDTLIDNLDTIDLHHGEYSASTAYSILEVLGASRSPTIEAKLNEYGFSHVEDTSDGFRAVRTKSLRI